MTSKYVCLLPLYVLLSLLGASPGSRAQGAFTIQVGATGAEPTPLVRHSDLWLIHKGTNAPAPGWQTNANLALDPAWAVSPGGFGYADNAPELSQVQLTLSDMQNRYWTLYLRRSFEITNAVDSGEVLQLVMDWDDGFVAWLDGVELAPRMNAPGVAGTEPGFEDTASASHESSGGNNSPQPAMIFSLGPAGDRLQPGTHNLAILGLNQATNSSDFVMVPELLLGNAQPEVINGPLLSIVKTNSVLVWGTNTIPGSARVLVNGVPANFQPGSGAWSHTVTLSPGFNRLLLEILDADGVQLLATNRDVVADLFPVGLGGTLPASTLLTSTTGVFHVTNSINVPPGGMLSIGPGCVLLLSPGASIQATNATVLVDGLESAPVFFLPADGSRVWGGLIGRGVAARISARHLETSAGHIQLLDGGQGIFENCYFHDYTLNSPPVLHTLGQPNHCVLSLRGCHLRSYYEVLCQLSTNLFEDCLLENLAAGGDGIDFDGGQPGSVIRRCTIRHGRFTNIDAIDMGEFSTGEPSRGVLVESCLLYDFVDKGVSMGVQVDVTVSNCLIHHLDAGIAVKDLSTAGIYNCTIVSNNFGFNCYNKANPSSPTGGGLITNSFNNILWGNLQALNLQNGSTLAASYSDFQGTPVPGAGNVSLDPLWLNPAGLDFRLGPASTLLSAGRDGGPMGAAFPVGAAMACSHPIISGVESQGTNVVLRFWADPEKSYSLLANDSVSSGTWAKVRDVFPSPLPRHLAITNGTSAGQARFYRLVTPRLP